MKKVTFRSVMRERLIVLKNSGVNKFVAYDLLGKTDTKKNLNQIQNALSDMSLDGEILRVLDNDKKVKRVHPNPDKTPSWIHSTVLLTQYEFGNLGNPDKTKFRDNDKKYKKAALERKETLVKSISVWEEVWPELYQVPKFKSNRVDVNTL